MQIGRTKFGFRNPIVTKRVSRKPIKYPSLSQWTGYKVTAVIQITASAVCVVWLVLGLRGLETSIPLPFIAIMMLQGLGAPYNFSLHRSEILRRQELYTIREYGS